MIAWPDTVFARVNSFVFFSAAVSHHYARPLIMATSTSAACCSRATRIWRRRTKGDLPPPLLFLLFYEPKPSVRVHADLFLSFSGITLLHHAAASGHLGICRLLVEAKADVGARCRCKTAAPGALALFPSLPALQQRQHCRRLGRRLSQGQRRCISSW
jgi:hypothetical protein